MVIAQEGEEGDAGPSGAVVVVVPIRLNHFYEALHGVLVTAFLEGFDGRLVGLAPASFRQLAIEVEEPRDGFHGLPDLDVTGAREGGIRNEFQRSIGILEGE